MDQSKIITPEPLRDFRVSDEVWLETFYPWLQSNANWWLELRAVEPEQRSPAAAPRLLRDASSIEAYLRQYRDTAVQRAHHLRKTGHGPRPASLLWGLQPRATNLKGSTVVAALVAVACSTSCDQWSAWPPAERPRVMWEALHRCPAAPSIINWTGTGFDSWWLLKEPLLEVRQADEVQTAIAHTLRADITADDARLFRWPHSVNYRGLPHSVRVLWWQPQLRFSMDELLDRFRPESKEATRWSRFLRLLPPPARMMWSSFSGNHLARSQNILNLALASTLLLHDSDRSDFESIARMAPWNASALSSANLDIVWTQAGEASPPVAAPATTFAPCTTMPSSPPPEEPALPGLLLSSLPETAWTDWARLYRAAVGGCTEAADEFHYLALLTVLGTALGRNVVVQSGRPVYMNLYTVLVGPTGDRKSTAAQMALHLLPQVTPRTLLLNGVGSQEGLMERMASQDTSTSTMWYVDELASLLKKARRESSGGLIEFITELFHCPEFKTHSTRSRAIHLQSPTLNVLAGSTPTWLEAALHEDDILGGFANRFVFVTGRPKPDNPLPSLPDHQALGKLVAWMGRAAKEPARELGLAAPAQDLWRQFYLEWRHSTAACSEHAAALLRRIDLYILKFAAISAAMDNAPEISTTHLNAAIDLGRFLAGCAYRVLGEVGASNDYRLEALIERKLREANGPLRRKQLRQSLGGRITGEKLDRVLNAMERNGLIRQGDDPTTRGTRIVQLT